MDKHKQIQRDYLSTFSTSPGERVLQDLKKQLVEKPVYGGGSDGIGQSLHMARRSAEIDLYNRIEKMIKKGSENE